MSLWLAPKAAFEKIVHHPDAAESTHVLLLASPVPQHALPVQRLCEGLNGRELAIALDILDFESQKHFARYVAELLRQLESLAQPCPIYPACQATRKILQKIKGGRGRLAKKNLLWPLKETKTTIQKKPWPLLAISGSVVEKKCLVAWQKFSRHVRLICPDQPKKINTAQMAWIHSPLISPERALRRSQHAVLYDYPKKIGLSRRMLYGALRHGVQCVVPDDLRNTVPGVLLPSKLGQKKKGTTTAALLKLHPTHSVKEFRKTLGLSSAGKVEKAKPAGRLPNTQPTVMLMASNGVGMGHLTRLLAIADAGKNKFRSIFMNYSAAIEPVANKGYLVFHIPSLKYLGVREHIGQLLQATDIRAVLDVTQSCAVLYDGNVLPSALMMALAQRPEIRLLWLRRGMWQRHTEPSPLAQQAWCDAVLEPGEWAGRCDAGPTKNASKKFVPPSVQHQTSPIMSDETLMSRTKVRKKLGLNKNKKYALLMLGGDYFDDHQAVLKLVLAQVKKAGYVPVLAEWMIAKAARYPRDLSVIRHYPFRPLFSGFDLAISAAGYNSFHELMATRTPTIFVPNEHARMDDQLARATFALQQGWAGLCRKDCLSSLASIIERYETVRRAYAPADLIKQQGAARLASHIVDALNA